MEGSDTCQPLLDAATPELFQANAFRITGLPVDATALEIAKHTNKLKILEELGQGASAHTAAFALKLPPTVDQIRDAIDKLKDPKRRLIDELFWFWPERFGQSRSDAAIQALEAGDRDTALGIWLRNETNHESGCGGLHNAAIVWQLTALDWENCGTTTELNGDRRKQVEGYWRESFKRWERLAVDDQFWDCVTARIRQLDDPRLTSGFVRRMRATLPAALGKISAELALRNAKSGNMELAKLHVRFMRETNQGLFNVEETGEMVLDPDIKRLKQQIQRAKQKLADKNPTGAANAARELLEHASCSLALFALFFGKNSYLRKEFSNEISDLCNQLSVAHLNATGDDKTSLAILEAALPLATSIELRQLIEKNIGTISGNLALRKSELEPVHGLLKAIQESKEHPSLLLDRFRREVIPALASFSAVERGGSETYADLFNSAAIVLRGISLAAWSTHQDQATAVAANRLAIEYAASSELKKRLVKDSAELKQMRHAVHLTPISSAPSLHTNGIGFTLYGSTDSDPTTGSYLTTYYFVFFQIPIFPICRYRVTKNGNSYRFFGKAPLRTWDKWHLGVSIALIVLLIIVAISSGRAPTSPSQSAPEYPPQSTYGARGKSTYQVPNPTSLELNRYWQIIETARTEAALLATQTTILANEIFLERSSLNQRSQLAVDAFNRKVDRYNSMLELARQQDRMLNTMVDGYNEKVRRYGR